MAEERIELIAVGDELLMGQTLDTNSHWIARRLAAEGMRLQRLIWSSDNVGEIEFNLKSSWNRSDAVIITGGLGPTHDDVTRPVIAAFFNDTLAYSEEIAESVRSRYSKRGINPAPGWETMAYFPIGAEPIHNDHGAAPGIYYHRDSKELFSLPGVPVEMKGMFDLFVLPKLISNRMGAYRFRIIRTIGAGESHLASLIGDPRRFEPVKLAFLPSIDTGVALRLSCYNQSEEAASAALNRAVQEISSLIHSFIYAFDEKTLEESIVEEYRARGLRLALAESCTGGMIASRLISIPGASDVLDRGWVVYSNSSKIEMLGVREETLMEFGAVSEETAYEMAIGVKSRSGVDVALSITGIAGPSGGSFEKPVGLVYIAVATNARVQVKRYVFTGDRDDNRRRSSLTALTLLYQEITR